MLSEESGHILAKMIQTLAGDEITVENLRLVLVENIDFEPFSCFQVLDRRHLNSINYQDIIHYFEKNEINCTESEAVQIIKQFESHSQKSLKYKDFYKIVLPATKRAMNHIAVNRRSPVKIPYNVEYQLSRLLEKELLLHRNLDINRKLLAARADFNVRNSFQSLDCEEWGYFNRELLNAFMRRNGIYFSDVEIDAVFRRWDVDQNEKICYSDYVERILPAVLNYNIRDSFRDTPKFIAPRLKQARNTKCSPDIASNSTQLQTSFDKYTGNSASFEQISSPMKESGFFNKYTGNSTSYDRSTPDLKVYTFSDKGTVNSSNYEINSSPVKLSILSDNCFEYSPSFDRSFTPVNLSTLSDKVTVSSASLERFSTPVKNSTISDKVSVRSDRFSPLMKQYTFSPDPGLRVTHQSTYTPKALKNLTYTTPELQYNTNPLTTILLNQENDLVSCIRSQIDLSRQLEYIRVTLSTLPDFNLVDGFRQFDTKGRTYITSSDIEEMLEKSDVKLHADEVLLLIKHYSSFKDNKLRFHDWNRMICSRENEYSMLLKNRNTYSSNPRKLPIPFSDETQRVFLEVIKSLLHQEVECERMRQELDRKPLFNLKESFGILDSDMDGFVSVDEVLRVISLHKVHACAKDLDCVMERFDKNRDGRVSYSEFLEELAPQSQFKY